MSDPNRNNPNQNNQNGPNNGPPMRNNRHFVIILVIALLLVLFYSTGNSSSPFGSSEVEEITYKQLVSHLESEEGNVLSAKKSGTKITGEINLGNEKPNKFETEVDPMDWRIIELLQKHAGEFEVSNDDNLLVNLLITLIPWLLIFFFFYFFLFRQMRSGGPGGIMSFGRSKAQMIEKDKLKKTFADVAGIDEARDEVHEIVEFLKEPEKFSKLGGRIPRGVLLVGPPGTGKTLLAKAIAGEADRPFFSISGSDFVEMFVGVGASRVRDLFTQAKANAPCIIFLDEIDAVGRRRGTGIGGGNDEREQTLNAILVEMDGFEGNNGIIIIAATNRADVLDPALLRPGRFDRQVYVDLPDIKGREQILKVHAKNVKLAGDVDLRVIARGTPGFSGAQLENLINEGAVIAALKGRNNVDMKILEEARDKVCWGKEKRSRELDKDELKKTAYHEAGHALLQILLPDADPLHKVTVVPRGQALGMSMYLPEKENAAPSLGFCKAQMIVLYGGRAAEELFCKDIHAGASMDIQMATNIARTMVTKWGMSEKLGPVQYAGGEEDMGWGESGAKRLYSEDTMKDIDAEIRSLIDNALNEARAMLKTNEDVMHRIAEALLKYETLDAEDVQKLIDGEDISESMAKRLNAKSADNDNDTPSATAEEVTEIQTVDATPDEEKGEDGDSGSEPTKPAPAN